jgi:ATP-dependent DNA helicase RecG
VVPIAELQEGDQFTVKGRVELIANKRSFKSRKMITECLVNDDTESLRVVWFNQPFLIKTIEPGDTVYLSGKVTKDMVGARLVSPVYEKEKKGETTHTARLVPIYPLTAGLTEKQLRFLMTQVIDLATVIPDWLPETMIKKYGFTSLSEALRSIHFPKDESDIKQSTNCLIFSSLNSNESASTIFFSNRDSSA